MEPVAVRTFIKDLIYDLETVQYLFDFGRFKETLPVMERVLDNIISFRASCSAEDQTSFFSETFWNNKLPANISFEQMKTAIAQLACSKSPNIEKDLEKLEYHAFVNHVVSWSDENIPKLRDMSKSPLQKKIEKTTLCLILVAAALALVLVLGWSFLTRDWGLKGDFYQGRNFEQYLYSGYTKTIDFSSPEEMDARLPHNNFSARWQGELIIPETGKYIISLDFDDGAKLIIDNRVLINQWQDGSHSFSKEIFLQKSTHKIAIEYYQWIMGAALKLSWAKDGSKLKIIPAKYLRH